MNRSLPETLDIVQAVTRRWEQSGTIQLSEFTRMPENVLANDATVTYELEFMPFDGLIGQAIVKVNVVLELICQRSLETFNKPIKISQTVGFIRHLDEENSLLGHMSPSLITDSKVNPKELIEDELLIVIPEFPVLQEAQTDNSYLHGQESDVETEQVDNPFSVLKKLKS